MLIFSECHSDEPGKMASARVCNLFLANGRCRISSQLLFNNPGRAPTGCRTFAIQTALLQRWKFPFIVTALCRKYTTAPPNSSEQLAVKDLVLPNLMDVPVKDIVKRRSILKSIYCYLFSSFYHAFNSAFHIRDFWEQVPQTIEVVSQHLAKQEYAKLHDYVRADVLRDLKHHIDQMTEEQRRQIALRRVDIFRKYVVWMKHVYPKLDRPDNDTYLEVTAVFHVRKELPKDVKTLSELMQRLSFFFSYCWLVGWIEFLYIFR